MVVYRSRCELAGLEVLVLYISDKLHVTARECACTDYGVGCCLLGLPLAYDAMHAHLPIVLDIVRVIDPRTAWGDACV